MESGRTTGRRHLSQINVTPLVDVMLVLLVIFMVTAPMMQAGIDVNLPKVEASAIKSDEQSLVVTVDRRGRLYVNDSLVSSASLTQRLSSMSTGMDKGRNATVVLRADASVPYGKIMEAMAQIRKAGITRIGLMTEPEEGHSDGAPL